MGFQSFPVSSGSASKTARKLTLTGGSSWTVPAGVTYVNVTCVGGGGGGGGATLRSGYGSAGSGGTGGTTSFSGADDAGGGSGGASHSYDSGDFATQSFRNGPATSASGSGRGAGAGSQYRTNSSGTNFSQGGFGGDGAVISSTVSTTPGASISYSVGGGGSAGTATTGGISGIAGASGRIDIEYWA